MSRNVSIILKILAVVSNGGVSIGFVLAKSVRNKCGIAERDLNGICWLMVDNFCTVGERHFYR